MSLTPSQEKFATGLAKGLSQAEAYRKAYPNSKKWKDESVWQKASVLASNIKVQSRVQELLQKAAAKNEITVERVLREIARLAFFDIRKLVNDDGTPKGLHELDDDTAAAIAGLDVARVGNAVVGEGEILKFKIADKNSALEKLAKHLQIFTDKLELTGKDGGPIQTQTIDPSKLSTEALAQIMAAKKC